MLSQRKKYSRKSKSKSKKIYSRKKEEENFDHSGWNNVYQQFITQNYNDPNEVQQLLNQIGGKKKKKNIRIKNRKVVI